MPKTWVPSRSLVAFAGRTALAATLGMLCSILIGLHEPHWAAWTVVSIGIPIRGDGLQKAFNRVIATAIGAPVGVLLVFLTHGNEPLLVGLLAIWLAVCVYAGLSLRNYQAYAAVLAGYTAVIIAMSLIGESDQLFEVGWDRCVGVFIGIACALLVLLLSRDVQSGQAKQRIREAIAAACAWAADRLAGLPRAPAADGSGPQRLRGQLTEILALDGAVHSATAESPALWARSRQLHGVVSALLDLLVASRGIERNFKEAVAGAISNDVDVAVAESSALLTHIARALRGEPSPGVEVLTHFRRQTTALRETLASLRAQNVIERRRIDLLSALLGATNAALQTYAALAGQARYDMPSYPVPIYALDRSHALAAALRAGVTLLLAGSLWIATGWQGGPMMAAFAAIVIALLAIRPNPRRAAIDFFASGAVGAGVALLAYVAVFPHIPHEPGIALAEGCILFLAIVIASLLSNAAWASGFSMVFLVVADPAAIAHTTETAVAEHALGVLAGCALAALAFHLVPSRKLEERWRKRHLRQIADAVRSLIASSAAPRRTEAHHAWQSRSIDTLMRIALPAATEADIDDSMSWIEIGIELLKLQDAVRSDTDVLPPSAKAAIRALLADLGTSEPHAWHARLLAADAQLQDKTLSAHQAVLSARTRVLELASLLQRVTTIRDRGDSIDAARDQKTPPQDNPSRVPPAAPMARM